jgi:hypothetical protein
MKGVGVRDGKTRILSVLAFAGGDRSDHNEVTVGLPHQTDLIETNQTPPSYLSCVRCPA